MRKMKAYEEFMNGTHLGNDQVNTDSATTRDISKQPEEYANNIEKKSTTLWTDNVINWCKNKQIDYKDLSRSAISNILKQTGSPENDMVIHKVWQEINDLDETSENI